MSTTLAGRAASAGVVIGPAHWVRHLEVDLTAWRQGTIEEETASFRHAIDLTERQIREMQATMGERVGEEEAAIFDAHAMFLTDPEIERLALEAIQRGASAPRAVIEAFDGFVTVISAIDDPYLSARAADLVDVRDQVVAGLFGVESPRLPDHPFVLLAEDVTPSQTAAIDPSLLLALVCEKGSEVAHAAILARSLGVPAVVGVGDGLRQVDEGDPVAVDGSTGEIVARPDPATLDDFESRRRVESERRSRLAAVAHGPAVTTDGRRVVVAANVNGPEMLAAAVESGAEGSGLVRSEFLFLGRAAPPGVEEQEEVYRRVLEAFGDHLVVIRTLDIGADKPVPYVSRQEPNPALGLRGLRLGLTMPDLLGDQLRALIRASTGGRLGIMFPMVSVPREVDAVLGMIETIAGQEGVDRRSFQVGTMIEVPSAALAAGRLANRLDFLSLGTNDLLQYLFAADRQVAEVAEIPDLFEPGVLALIRSICDEAHAADVWVGVCGEAAADRPSAAALVAAGVDELSMSPPSVPEIKEAVRGWEVAGLRLLLDRALAAQDGPTARRLFKRC